MRVLACVLALIALAGAGSAGAAPHAACPHLAGAITYVRVGKRHVLTLANCTDRVTGRATVGHAALRSRQGRVATIRVTGAVRGLGAQTIVVDGKPVLRVREDYRSVPGGEPGPLGLVMWSPDGRYLFYYVDPMGSASLAADGLVLRALDVATGRARAVALMLLNDDYMTWCGSTLLLTVGPVRLATTSKRLVAARAPGWRPRAVWSAPARAFGSVTCAPGGKSVAVLSQQAQKEDWSFFATRWQLWQVGLDGSHTLLDAPPAGYADESPAWSPDGSSLAFVRERNGWGTLELLHDGTVYGPLANLGYSLGYYGHHDWGIAWQA